MKPCFFCDLGQSRREIADLILQNDESFSMYDAAPASPGHALVTPKAHIKSIFDLKPGEFARLREFSKATKEIVDNYDPDGYNIGVNEGKAAGQTVFHLHIHLIPRYEGDVVDPTGGIRNLFPQAVPPAQLPEGYFCDLAQGKKEIPGLILQNDEFFSMYDAAPARPGHALVIPKKHIVSFFEDLELEYVARLHEFSKATKEEIDKKHNPDGYNIGVNEGKAAGSNIDHLHIHLIPRYEGDVEYPRGGVRNLFPQIVPPASLPEGYD